MAQSKARKLFGKIHLYLGLTTGLIVFIISITGSIYVFNTEITSLLRKEFAEIEPYNKLINVDKLWSNTQNTIDGKYKISWLTKYSDKSKSWIFTCYKPSRKSTISYYNSVEYYISVYVNPETGEILKVYDEELDFFHFVKMLHWSLLFTTDIGQPIVGYSTIIFVIMLITGVIIWWPKKRNQRKQKFKFNWKSSTRWRRKNYDIHSILGFYSSLFLLIIAFTGMVWAFSWFQNLVYVIGSGTTEAPDLKPMKSQFDNKFTPNPLNKCIAYMDNNYSNCEVFRVVAPKDTSGCITITAQQTDHHYSVLHKVEFDKYSGRILKTRNHRDKNFGEKLITANYDIHTGSILGLPGKIIAFIASIISASLPITGFMVYLGRKRKKVKSNRLL